jgi:hypothetical protein
MFDVGNYTFMEHTGKPKIGQNSTWVIVDQYITLNIVM